MYLYSASGFEGDDPASDKGSIYDCSEGSLKWIPKEQVTSLNLWEGDRYFIEPMIRGQEHIEMTCVYDGDRLTEVY